MSSRAAALIGAAFILAAGGWIAHLYGKLELQEARYETRIAVLAEEVSQKDKARAEAVACSRAGRPVKNWKRKRPAWPHYPPSFQTPAKSWQKSVKTLMRVCKRWLLLLAAIVLACLLVGCASTTKPLDLPPVPVVAPGSESADPAGTVQNTGQAGTARAGVRGDALATPEDVLAHVRDYGGYCRGLEVQLATLARVVSP